MKLVLITVGKKMPDWVNTAFSEYNKRLPAELNLHVVEVIPAKRNKSTTVAAVMKEEMQRIQAALPRGAIKVVLDENGRQLSSTGLSKKIDNWQQEGRDIALIIGSADGLDDDLLESADFSWSLSSLTLPHALVRVIVAEQIYRAWSILSNHPYHRE
ncbi:MAG TPA: 23S rRNA (pseudouridine(1915)-N(3))-methyltransferase RlmH [Gammaproteobacteria bacterium]|nr:23S rRNA (pseudouridine(1915)-N(3))-methyltransferase RlmH [Gammaproteobacteria bacterium]